MPHSSGGRRTLEALGALRAESLGRLAAIRVAGAASFLVVVSWLGLTHELEDWRVYVVPLSLYAAIAVVLLRAHSSALNAWAVPLLDVPAVFVLQFLSMPMSPFPAGVAGWSLGLFVFFCVLSALSLETPVLVTTLVVSSIAEGVLQRSAGVGWGAVVASALVLSLTTAATAWAARRLVSMIGLVVSSEVARRVAEEESEELARAKTSVERINRELQEAQRNAETLSNLLVHDMKGPLTAVLGTFDLVEMRLEDAGEVEAAVPGLLDDFATGRRAASRLLGMIGDLLGIARLEHSGIRASRSDVDVAAMVSEVAEDHARSAASRGVRLFVRTASALPASVDAELVRRALDNLVSNAISFAGRDQRVEVEAAGEDGALVLRVRNDGPVIAPEARANLFGKHSMMGARRGHHAGLGLYLCRLVAESHGGDIALVDEAGWSVSFAMRLPGSCVLESKPAA